MQESLAQGADLVCFSADKLVGGSQGGVIAGKKRYIEPLLKHPLLRVIRLDKLSSIALEATIKLYLKKEADKIPVWRMMALSPADIEARAHRLIEGLSGLGITAEIQNGESTVGGGSLPGQSLPTRLVALKPPGSLEAFARRLRTGDPPLIGRIEAERLLLDLRTVLPDQDGLLIALIAGAWQGQI